MDFKAAIFDLDGTLVDTLYDLADSTNYSLNKNGFKTKPRENYGRYAGDGIYKMIERALEPEKVDTKTLKKLRDDFFEYYKDNCTINTYVYDGMQEVIGYLRANNIKVGCITNKIDAIAKVIINHYFGELDIGCGQVDGVPTKPDPYLPNKAFEILSVNAEECLFIGDSDVDMKTAKNSGMYGIGAAWGFRSKEELLINGADFIADNPIDILKVFKNGKL